MIDELDRCPYSTLLKYVATDVSASWGASLTQAIKAPSLDFQVRPSFKGSYGLQSHHAPSV